LFQLIIWARTYQWREVYKVVLLNNNLKPNFIDAVKFNNNVYQCELAKKTFKCKLLLNIVSLHSIILNSES
jgi:hypothetical protein